MLCSRELLQNLLIDQRQAAAAHVDPQPRESSSCRANQSSTSS
jgi:hypothetical protein